MEIFADGRVYVSRGEQLPMQCPQCEHIMPWHQRNGRVHCEKCDYEDRLEEFCRVVWQLTKLQ